MSAHKVERLIRSVESRVSWLLSDLTRFSTYDNFWKYKIPKPVLEDEEFIIGVYENTESFEELIAATNFGIHLECDNNWRYFEYTFIKEVNFPVSDKISWHYLILSLKNGEKIKLPIRNRKNQYEDFDLFSFAKFISGLILSLRSI